MSRSVVGFVVLFVLAGAFVFMSCEETDPLEKNVSLTGEVANNSGVAGSVIVEIDHNLTDVADTEGRYEIRVHQDFYIDSLYAWVDKNGDGKSTSGEPYGFSHSQSEPGHALSFQVRGDDVSNLNFDIPGQ